MKVEELFWGATIEELKKGYTEKGQHFVCLLCGRSSERGIVYEQQGVFYEAEKFMQLHLKEEHQSVFHHLMGLDKKLTGLTEHQNRLLRLFYEGKSDGEIREEMGIGSASTIRNHRFVLKEKERQAKLFLTLMELLKEHDHDETAFIPIHPQARMIDDRYNVTEEESIKILNKYFPQGVEGKLASFPPKEKQRLIILRAAAERISSEKKYDEKEMNTVLAGVFDDYVLLRRYLIEYGFLAREKDGSAYWLKK
ncbi:DUF2087 domain-containing protein [Cytobacillus gottheilii]|uniref:DUF2087 domain-containing protein n=1 Tax=Cytobacillus gottheilii TaxID=859144 RepID=UPI0009BAC153|nr:DUF2087 domain-containing protein [Cytobacillus gottheilii]